MVFSAENAWNMKTSVLYITGSAVLSTALIWSCIKTEIINRTQTDEPYEPAEDMTESPAEDKTRVDDAKEQEDTTRHEISFDVTVSAWVEG